MSSPSIHSVDVGTESFEQDVLAASFERPVLVDFWAPWCGPCRTLKPMLEKLADDYAGRFLLAKVNSDEHQELSAHFQVRSIPTVKAFVNGQVADEFMGALPEAQVRAFIDRLLPSLGDPLRAEASALIAAGDPESALARLIEGSAIDPTNEGIRLDAVEVLLTLNRPDEAQQLLELEYTNEADRAQALRARLALAENQVDEATLTALKSAVAQNPKDPAARIALGRALAAGQQHEAALEEFLESVLRDKTFNDGEARRAMLQMFELLGSSPQADDLIRHYRRQLSAALN